MPAIKRIVTATTQDALNGLKFKTQGRPALVSLYASTDAAGSTISFSVGSSESLVNAAVNVEAADRTVDTDRDGLLIQEPVPPGEYFMPITVGTTDVTFLLIIEPVGS